MEWWQTLIVSVVGLGVFGDILAHIFLPYRRKEDRAKAVHSEADAITTLNSVAAMLAERVKSQNGIIDDKTDRIRELTDLLNQSEREKDDLNAKLVKKTEENAKLRVQVEHYKMWVCKRSDCQDPRGGRPPREHLAGIKYVPPQD